MVNNDTKLWCWRLLLQALLWPSLIALFQQSVIVNAQASFGGDETNNNNNDDEGEMIRLRIKFSDVNERAQFQDTMINPRFSTSGGNTKEEVAGPTVRQSSSSSGPTWYAFQDVYQFSRTNITAVSIPKTQYASFVNIATERNIQVSVDNKMRPFQIGEEVVPYGISYTQATVVGDDQGNNNNDDATIPSPPQGAPCFKVCIIDDGLLVTHPDIPYQLGGGMIDGKRFGLPSNKQWWNASPQAQHGTHVAGTIIAEGGNNLGVVGMIPDPQGICLMIGRVFDERGTQDESHVMAAVEWCADNGARVINMSLGGETRSDDEEEFFASLWDEGIMVVAAAGNKGEEDYMYPASYPNILSVAAVDEDLERAPFSVQNDEIDLSAPGVNVLSTSVSSSLRIIDHPNNREFDANLMEFSIAPDVDGWDKVTFVDCQKGTSVCENSFGRVCVMERGDILFAIKALNCQDGGGIAALIYNNEPGKISGSLGEADTGVEIPVLSMARDDGLDLLDGTANTVSLEVLSSGYITLSGTSMASPHVAGAAARIWAARPECTNAQIQEALFNTAMSLGNNNKNELKNDEYGYGLVQVVDAYNYLVDNFDAPCGGEIADGTDGGGSVGTCMVIGEDCVTDTDCCSGQCRRLAVDKFTCRPIAKAVKTKLGGSGSGGSAGGARQLRTRRGVRGR